MFGIVVGFEMTVYECSDEAGVGEYKVSIPTVREVRSASVGVFQALSAGWT